MSLFYGKYKKSCEKNLCFFEMSEWSCDIFCLQTVSASQKFHFRLAQELNKCGTVRCIGGWTRYIVGEKFNDQKLRDILGLPNDNLFFISSWPETYRIKYFEMSQQETHPQEFAQLTCELIDEVIRTDGAILE